MLTSAILFLGNCLIFIIISSTGAEGCAKVILKEKEGVISSPNFPDQYDPNTCTQWIIEKPNRTVVTLSFTYVDLPQGIKGDDSCYGTYVELGFQHPKRFCGRQPSVFSTVPYRHDSQFYIKFISGRKPAGRGFRLQYFVGQ